MSLVATTGVMAQDEATPPGSAATVVPITEDPLGVSYGEWAGRWWQWIAGIPLSENPMTGDHCQVGQGGDVFFIPHTSPGSTVTTTCQIGADQWVYASAGGTIWTDTEGETAEELTALVNSERGVFSDLAVIVDDVPVPDIEAFWAVSDPFTVTYIEDDLLGGEPGAQNEAVAASFGVMIPPLEPGEHTIVVRDTITHESVGPEPAVAELTANITVAAE
jgi:hypothetical protein